MNAKLPVWVRKSVGKYFADFAATQSIPLQIGGVDADDPQIRDAPRRVELRVHGPTLREHDSDVFYGEVSVNLLFTDHTNVANYNVYDIIEIIGEFQWHCNNAIPIYGESENLIGCLETKSDRSDTVRLYDFGELIDQEGVRQLMVDAHYYIETHLRG